MASALTRTAAAIGLLVVGCSAQGAPLCCICQEWDDSKGDAVIGKECKKDGQKIDETQDTDVCESKGGTMEEATCSETKMGASIVEPLLGAFGETMCTMGLTPMGQCCKGGETSGFRNDGKTCQDAPDPNKQNGKLGPQCCVCDAWDDSKLSYVAVKECQKDGATIDETHDAAVCTSKGGTLKETTCAELKLGAPLLEGTLGIFGEGMCKLATLSMGACCQSGSTAGFRDDGKKCGAEIEAGSAHKSVASSLVIILTIFLHRV
eukprot:TRINITY_DN2239_c0_g2_i1.p1 TRINITY_DN2239_c0_g2~~TRINITY_DN2239_c0_g2_i1.p1  ORF type:complete len:282 (-),score=43.69 TRINITY_DN2239_c0_g2_i1:229-1017(-)